MGVDTLEGLRAVEAEQEDAQAYQEMQLHEEQNGEVVFRHDGGTVYRGNSIEEIIEKGGVCPYLGSIALEKRVEVVHEAIDQQSMQNLTQEQSPAAEMTGSSLSAKLAEKRAKAAARERAEAESDKSESVVASKAQAEARPIDVPVQKREVQPEEQDVRTLIERPDGPGAEGMIPVPTMKAEEKVNPVHDELPRLTVVERAQGVDAVPVEPMRPDAEPLVVRQVGGVAEVDQQVLDERHWQPEEMETQKPSAESIDIAEVAEVPGGSKDVDFAEAANIYEQQLADSAHEDSRDVASDVSEVEAGSVDAGVQSSLKTVEQAAAMQMTLTTESASASIEDDESPLEDKSHAVSEMTMLASEAEPIALAYQDEASAEALHATPDLATEDIRRIEIEIARLPDFEESAGVADVRLSDSGPHTSLADSSVDHIVQPESVEAEHSLQGLKQEISEAVAGVPVENVEHVSEVISQVTERIEAMAELLSQPETGQAELAEAEAELVDQCRQMLRELGLECPDRLVWQYVRYLIIEERAIQLHQQSHLIDEGMHERKLFRTSDVWHRLLTRVRSQVWSLPGALGRSALASLVV